MSSSSSEQVLISVLRQLGTDRVPHGRRALLDHLAGTCRLLRKWGCADPVCRAGLFHSVYGTNAFEVAALTHLQRPQVRKLIGEDAERLAYLFSVIERPGALLRALRSGRATNRLTGESHALERDTLHALIEIECANLVEQGAGGAFLRELAPALLAGDFPQSLVESVAGFAGPTAAGV